MAGERRLIRNRARCRVCGDVIESRHRWDYVQCSCGRVAVDGGLDYLKRVADNWSDIEELSEWAGDGGRRNGGAKVENR